VVYREVFTDVSGTTNVCTEEHEPDKRHKCVDKQAHHCEVRRTQKRMHVDPAGIDRKLFTLPREVSLTTSWKKGEVSRGHSSGRKRAPIETGEVSQNHEGLNVNWFQML